MSCRVNGSGLGRSIVEIEQMSVDHILRDRDRLIDLYDRLAAAARK